MIEGLLGILLAFVIFILVLFFGKRKPDQKIYTVLNKVMQSLGFSNLEHSNPEVQAIKEALKLTIPHLVYLEQAFYRSDDDLIVCWINKRIESDNNALISVIPQKMKTGNWILANLPSIKGKIGNIINKSYELSLSSLKFTKLDSHFFGQPTNQFALFVHKNEPLPSFSSEFFNLLQQVGNVIIRSSGKILLIERISVFRDETWEQEAKELLRITKLFRELI